MESSRTSPGTSGVVSLTRTRHSWTGAGSAAGIVLRYLSPMRRMMIDVCGDEPSADHALGILIQHLVNAGFGDQRKGLLRDFLIRGIRSAAKAQRAHMESREREREAQLAATNQPYIAGPPPPPLNVGNAQATSPIWIRFWSEGLIERAWRSLERHQHASRHRGIAMGQVGENDPSDATPKSTAKEIAHDLVYDVLRTVFDHPGESAKMLSSRVATRAERPVTDAETKEQLAEARILLAQFVADEVAQTIHDQDAKLVQSEIKVLGLQKAFAGVAVRR